MKVIEFFEVFNERESIVEVYRFLGFDAEPKSERILRGVYENFLIDDILKVRDLQVKYFHIDLVDGKIIYKICVK